MSEYLVLARKYRSRTFDEVVGQEAISTTLKNAITSGRIAHAYLFTGTRGVGKTTVARILAKALNCLSSDGPTTEPCGQCDACISIARGDDMDVIEIDGASNRGIDEIRDLRSNAALHPARARYKVYYIDEVHMLTKEAFNALLKTLEEPPAHVKFIFATTEVEKVPATILSRCQRFDFRNIPTDEIAGHLRAICESESIEAEQAAIFRVARSAAGSMRDGLSLLDQLISSTGGQVTDADVLRVLGTPPEESVAALMGAIAANDPAAALEQLDTMLLAGLPLEGLVTALADQYRNIMLALTCGPDSRLIELAESHRAALAEVARHFTVPSAVQGVGVCEQLGRAVRGSSSARALTEAAIVRLAAADKFVDAASLVERLERLNGGRGPSAPALKKNSLAATDAGPAGRFSAGRYAPNRPAPAPAPSPAPARPSAPPESSAPAPAREPQPPAEPSARQVPLAGAGVTWQGDWLREHWGQFIQAASEQAGPAVAGILRGAKLQSVGPGAIELGFDTEDEPMRQRAAGAMAERIEQALSALAGQSVRCRFVATGHSRGTGRVVSGVAMGGINSADRVKVAQDPAVKAVTDLFGGQVADIRPDAELLRASADPASPSPADEPLAPESEIELDELDED